MYSAVHFCKEIKIRQNSISKVKLATLVEGGPKAPFSIATTSRCRGGHFSIPQIAPFYSWFLLYNAEWYQVPFFVIGMTRPGIEPRSSRPLANILLIRLMVLYKTVYIIFNTRSMHSIYIFRNWSTCMEDDIQHFLKFVNQNTYS